MKQYILFYFLIGGTVLTHVLVYVAPFKKECYGQLATFLTNVFVVLLWPVFLVGIIYRMIRRRK